MLGRKINYEFGRKIGHIVKDLNTHTVMEYQPEKVIIEYVRDFWLTNYEKDTLLLAPISLIDKHARNTFNRSFPDREEAVAESFSNDTIFHLAFKLSHQGQERDFV